MIARRPVLMLVAVLCVLVGGLVGATPGLALVNFGGSGLGTISQPSGIALGEGGDVYISDEAGEVHMFTASGEFLTSWGRGAFAGEGPRGVAVDNEAGSAAGDVYVEDWEDFRVEKFDPSGKFLLMFGGGVNEKTGGDVCAAGEACKNGTQGTATGEFEWVFQGSYIAVGPSGRVYVGDKARIQVFEPSGVWRESISLAGLSSEGQVSSLAVNAAGDMFVKDEGVAGVREFEPDGVEKSTQFDATSESVASLALGAFGDLFVADNSGHPHLLEYSASGEELASFGGSTLTTSRGLAHGIAYSEALDELYVPSYAGVWVFPVPGPGPVVEGESGTGGLRGTASLEGTVDPENHQTSYHFEYVKQSDYEASGYADASSTPSASLEPSFEEQAVSAQLTGLTPGVSYHYRLVASNSQGTLNGPDQTMEEPPADLVDGPWATDVASTSATLSTRIDPQGTNTTYRLEYGTSTSYGTTLTGNAGEGESYIPISDHIQGLQPATTYHYRVLTSTRFGTVEGADHTFTTQTAAGNELTLLDGRQWELVSPANKKGALLTPTASDGNLIQVASDGDAISYGANEPLGEDPVASIPDKNQVLSVRGPDGWRSQDVTVPQGTVREGQPTAGLEEYISEYRAFSPDLSSAIVEPQETSAGEAAMLSPGVTERTLYLRNDITGEFKPLVSSANVPPGTKYGGYEESTSVYGKSASMSDILHVFGATPDLSHVVLGSELALTPEAESGFCGYEGCRSFSNLYEWNGSQIQLVDILPNGEPWHDQTGEGGAGLGLGDHADAHAISSDGRRIVWYTGALSGGTKERQFYVRDMVEKKTVPFGGHDALFETMSTDGSRIFYLEGEDLFELDWDTGTATNLTPNSHGESAGVQDAALGASEDGSRVYFVAKADLAAGATNGRDNLYVMHEESGGWTTVHIATLSSQDEQSWASQEDNKGGGFQNFAEVTSRVSPNGRYLTFMSDQPLTGYDNADARSGEPDEEVYLYDAVTDHLVCASCVPTGARPDGIEDIEREEEGHLVLPLINSAGEWRGHWLAASLPGWHLVGQPQDGIVTYQPRYLSDSGRLFFDSPDALVPQATNGLTDVYEYEPAGVGSCSTGGETFDRQAGGCVDLISAGDSSEESLFYDASENGDDVFFTTAEKLTGEDFDDAYDIYDAHVCSEEAPCNSSPVSPPPCTSGDSCKAAPSPQPAIFGPAPSATFSGVGNVIEEAKSAKPKTKKAEVKPKHKRHGKKRHKLRKKAKKAEKRLGMTGHASGKDRG